MLEWLDVESVAWGRYHHAYGPATDVPDLLRALAAPSQASKWIRRRADKAKKPVLQHVVWALWGNLFHQGSVYAASAKAVPFLVAILKRSQSRDDHVRQFIVEYLHHLACGYYADRFPVPVDIAALEAACASAESAGLPDAVFDGGAWNLIPDTAGPQVARAVAACCPFAENLEQLGQAMLSRLPPSANTWVIDRLAERLRAAVGFSKLPSLHSLLVRGAPWCHPEPTPTQRQILRIIVEHGDWGRFVNVNQAEILRAMGLPADRERLSALAS